MSAKVPPKLDATLGLTNEVRAQHWLEEFRLEFARRGLLGKCIEAIEGGLKAVTTVRVRDDSQYKGWGYQWTEDHAIRLTAARLGLAYAAGNPPTQADVRLTGGPVTDAGKTSVTERLAELHACGISLQVIADVLKREDERLRAVDVTPPGT